MIGWLPLRSSLVLAALAAVALAGLTLGLLEIVSANAREVALVRAQADAALLVSKAASLPAAMPAEERDAELSTIVVVRALAAVDGNRCDSGEATRALLLLRLPSGETTGTPGLRWPSAPDSQPLRFAVAKGVACQREAGTAIGILSDLGGGRRLLTARVFTPDPALQARAYALGAGIALGFLVLAAALALALMRGWRARLEAFNAVLDRADRNRFAERADEAAGPPEFQLLASHLNALLGRSAEMIDGMQRLHRHVAHDLRGPLMVARRHLDTLEAAHPAEPLIAEIDAKVGLIDKRCRMLLGIIDAEISRRTELDEIDPDARIRQLIDGMFVYLADDKDLDFTVESVPALVRLPADLFDRMIENILGNAVKFATSQSIIRCSVSRDGPWVLIAVENDGPTVAERKLERIFEPGYSDAANADSHGLGLAFVKTVAGRSGGNARATNIAAGFRIEISLPAADDGRVTAVGEKIDAK